jgi:ABC-type Fe3+ transport system substrate-binding protein
VNSNIFGHSILELQLEGAPVDIVHPDPVVVGPRHFLLGKRAPHPDAARLFIDYTLSVEGQSLLALMGRTVVRPGIKLKQPRLIEGGQSLSDQARDGERLRGSQQTVLFH